MTRPPVFIHIGSPKSGTTTLQEGFFPNLDGVCYRDWGELSSIPNFEKLFYGDSIYYDQEEAIECRNRIHALLESSDGKAHLYSREHLVHNALDITDIARKLDFFFDTPHILLTIRNQFTAMESSYLWALRAYRSPGSSVFPNRSYEKYISNTFREAGLRGRYMNLARRFDYGLIAKTYAEIVGKENIAVFCMEGLATSPEQYYRKIGDYLGIPSDTPLNLPATKALNTRLSRRKEIYYFLTAMLVPLGLHFLVRRHKMPAAFDRFLSGGKKNTVALSDSGKELIRLHFREGNQYLIDEFGLPLDNLGYPT
jgi:hypothetical protein